MIKSFADKDAERIFRRGFSRRLPADIQQTGLRKLRMLDNAQSIRDLEAPPGNKLEKLKGDRQGQYAIRINDQWRVCFFWREGDAYQVEITDDH